MSCGECDSMSSNWFSSERNWFSICNNCESSLRRYSRSDWAFVARLLQFNVQHTGTVATFQDNVFQREKKNDDGNDRAVQLLDEFLCAFAPL